MAKKQEYTCVSYIEAPNGTLIEFSTLSPEQKQAVRARIAANVSKALSDFLTAHPEEIEPLSRCESVELIREAGTA